MFKIFKTLGGDLTKVGDFITDEAKKVITDAKPFIESADLLKVVIGNPVVDTLVEALLPTGAGVIFKHIADTLPALITRFSLPLETLDSNASDKDKVIAFLNAIPLSQASRGEMLLHIVTDAYSKQSGTAIPFDKLLQMIDEGYELYKK